MQKYKHRRLDLNSSQIRLLRVEKVQEDQLIVLSLRHADLDDGESFNALSYAWGDDDVLYDIVIRDRDESSLFSIRLNLYDFLTTAFKSQETWTSHWIWIDQSHHEERCHQVAQMSKIYSTALATVVWPGSITPQEHLGQTDDGVSTPLFSEHTLEDLQTTRIVATEFPPLGPVFPSSNAIRLLSMFTELMLDSLVTTSYWSRLWIIQEIILASQVHVVLAGQIWDLDDFHLVLAVMLDHRILLEPRMGDRTFGKIWVLKSLIDQFSTQRYLGRNGRKLQIWPWALVLSNHAKCTLPFDQVYGVMALLDKDLHVQPDYTISQRDLLRAILEKQLFFPSYFDLSIWSLLDQTIWLWSEFLSFDPIGTTSGILDEDTLMNPQMQTAAQKETRRRFVQLVLEDLGLPLPTVILSLDQRRWWKIATTVVHKAYTEHLDLETCLAEAKGREIGEHESEDATHKVDRWVYLQQSLIDKASGQNDTQPHWKLPNNTLSQECQEAEDTWSGRHTNSRSYRLFTRASGEQNSTQSPSVLPAPLLRFILVGTESENAVGNYDTGIPYP